MDAVREAGNQAELKVRTRCTERKEDFRHVLRLKKGDTARAPCRNCPR